MLTPDVLPSGTRRTTRLCGCSARASAGCAGLGLSPFDARRPVHRAPMAVRLAALAGIVATILAVLSLGL